MKPTSVIPAPNYLLNIRCATCGEVFEPETPISGAEAADFIREYQTTHPHQGAAFYGMKGRPE